MATERDGQAPSGRELALSKVRGWFAPAFEPGEDLRAALMATPYPLTVVNSLVATAARNWSGATRAACYC